MLPTEKILRRMDSLYEQAVEDPDNEQVKGELLGLAEALVFAHQTVTVDDIRSLMAERYAARTDGHARRAPSLRRMVNKRLETTAA